MSDLISAVHLVRYGNAADGLELAKEPAPGKPGPGEALVAVEYAPINVNDLMIVWDMYAWHPSLPIAIGNEGSGTVLAVGPGVSDVQAGDHVVLPFMSRTWREQMIVEADQLVVVPNDADPHQTAMLSINAVTAVMLLDDYVSLQPGDALVYNAATSGLGHWIAALAARRGLRAVGLVRRPEDLEGVRQSCPGVDVVSDDEDLATVRTRLDGLEIKLALDGVAGSAATRLVQLLSPGGTLVTYGAASRQPIAIPSGDLIFRRIRVEGFWEGHPVNAARIVPTLRTLVGMIGPNGVRQPLAGVYQLDQLREAVEHATLRGKVLLDFGGRRS